MSEILKVTCAYAQNDWLSVEDPEDGLLTIRVKDGPQTAEVGLDLGTARQLRKVLKRYLKENN